MSKCLIPLEGKWSWVLKWSLTMMLFALVFWWIICSIIWLMSSLRHKGGTDPCGCKNVVTAPECFYVETGGSQDPLSLCVVSPSPCLCFCNTTSGTATSNSALALGFCVQIFPIWKQFFEVRDAGNCRSGNPSLGSSWPFQKWNKHCLTL